MIMEDKTPLDYGEILDEDLLLLTCEHGHTFVILGEDFYRADYYGLKMCPVCEDRKFGTIDFKGKFYPLSKL